MPRFRLAFAPLLAAASLVAASPLAAQVRPLGGEEVVVSGEEGWGSCPVAAGHDDGSAVLLRSHGGLLKGGDLLSVSAAFDGSFSSDHLLDPNAGHHDYASVTATADGYVAVWRLPGIWFSPGSSLPGEYAEVALDAAGAPTSAPVRLHHRNDWISPRRIGGYVATIQAAGRNGIDIQLLSPLGEAVSAPAAVVRTRWDTVTIPQAVLHRPDGRFTVLWTEMRRIAGSETGAGVRSHSAPKPLGDQQVVLGQAPEQRPFVQGLQTDTGRVLAPPTARSRRPSCTGDRLPLERQERGEG